VQKQSLNCKRIYKKYIVAKSVKRFYDFCMALLFKIEKSKSGLTLIEAVLALAILAISVIVFAETTARCFKVIRVSRNYEIARSVLDRGEADFPLSSTNSLSQNEVDGFLYENGFKFSRNLEEMAEEEKVFIVRTRVSWSEYGKDSFEEVVSLLYCPNED
jgi:hypothetical protein